MEQLNRPAGLVWQRYLGRDLYSADSHRLGAVVDIQNDPLSGELYLRIEDDPSTGRSFCVPVSVVGVVSRSRIMLDVPLDQLSRLHLLRDDRDMYRTA